MAAHLLNVTSVISVLLRVLIHSVAFSSNKVAIFFWFEFSGYSNWFCMDVEVPLCNQSSSVFLMIIVSFRVALAVLNCFLSELYFFNCNVIRSEFN